MGGGNERKKARKQAKKDARKARQEMARQTQMFEKQLEAQRAQMLAEAERARRSVPTQTGATIGSLNQGVAPASSKRKTVTNLGRGISSLRIPLNLRDSGGGMNIG
jgi:F0F1-type ATP synthase membrane subunit b/b'